MVLERLGEPGKDLSSIVSANGAHTTPVPAAGLAPGAAATAATAVTQAAMMQAGTPVAALGVDLNHDGRADFTLLGPDLNQNGVPDAIDRVMSASRTATPARVRSSSAASAAPRVAPQQAMATYRRTSVPSGSVMPIAPYTYMPGAPMHGAQVASLSIAPSARGQGAMVTPSSSFAPPPGPPYAPRASSFVAGPGPRVSSFVAPPPAQAPCRGQLTQGMPDPAAIDRQAAAYARQLEEQLATGLKALQEKNAREKQSLKEAAKQKKLMTDLMIEQMLQGQSADIEAQENLQMLQLKQEAMGQKMSLENQANTIKLEYQQKRAAEDMMFKQYELQKKYFEEHQRMVDEAVGSRGLSQPRSGTGAATPSSPGLAGSYTHMPGSVTPGIPGQLQQMPGAATPSMSGYPMSYAQMQGTSMPSMPGSLPQMPGAAMVSMPSMPSMPGSWSQMPHPLTSSVSSVPGMSGWPSMMRAPTASGSFTPMPGGLQAPSSASYSIPAHQASPSGLPPASASGSYTPVASMPGMSGFISGRQTVNGKPSSTFPLVTPQTAPPAASAPASTTHPPATTMHSQAPESETAAAMAGVQVASVDVVTTVAAATTTTTTTMTGAPTPSFEAPVGERLGT